MINLEHQNPSTVRRDENSVNVAGMMRKEEQLRLKLDQEKQAKHELVERLTTEKEEIKLKTKQVVDMFKQRLSTVENELNCCKNVNMQQTTRHDFTQNLLNQHLSKWRSWHSFLQFSDSIGSFADFLLDQPMQFITTSFEHSCTIEISSSADIPGLMISELDSIIKLCNDTECNYKVEDIVYLTVRPAIQDVNTTTNTMLTNSITTTATSNSHSQYISEQKSLYETTTTKDPSSSIKRKPLLEVDLNTNTSSSRQVLSSPLRSKRTSILNTPTRQQKQQSTESFSIYKDNSGSSSDEMILSDEDRQQSTTITTTRDTATTVIHTTDATTNTTAASCSITTATDINTTASSSTGSSSSSNNNNSDVQSELFLLQEKLEKSDQIIDTLTVKCQYLETTLTKERELHTSQIEENLIENNKQMDLLNKKIIKLKNKLEKNQYETAEINSILQQNNDKYSNLQLNHTIEIENLNNSINMYNNTIINLENEIEKLNKELIIPTTTINTLENQLINSNNEYKILLNKFEVKDITLYEQKNTILLLQKEINQNNEKIHEINTDKERIEIDFIKSVEKQLETSNKYDIIIENYSMKDEDNSNKYINYIQKVSIVLLYIIYIICSYF